MAVDMFLKIDGIKGESSDSKHKEEVDVLSWSWGMTQSGSHHIGGGGGAGKVNVQDLHITKYIDKSSPNLMQVCCDGKHIASAVLTVRKAGGTALEYLKIKLTDILVSSVSTGGSGGGDILTENVAFNFAKVEVAYTPQDKTGKGGGAVEMAWSIEENA